MEAEDIRASKTRFWKYQGLGNDFVLVDRRQDPVEPTAELARALCDRRLGVGADGLLVLLPPRAGGDARMAYRNSDGSFAEMCGNGIRCLVRHLFEHDRPRSDWVIETDAGPMQCTVHLGSDRGVESVDVQMGRAEVEGDFPLSVLDRSVHLTAIRTGNPHAVTFDDVDDASRALLGPAIERHPRFPDRTNVEFASVPESGRLVVAVWERGVGFTRACGTGACAAAVAACVGGRAPFDAPVRVSLPGGDLVVTVPRDLSRIRMRGPAARVFEGTIEAG